LKVREVLVHRPGTELRVVDKPHRWMFNDYVDFLEMQKEHDKLVKALQDEGVKIHYLMKPSENKPKLYMVRDSAVVLDGKAVTCHFIHSVRRGEEQLVKQRLKELGIKITGHIYVPGFLQGSDVFLTDKNHAFAIAGYESNMEGIEHLRDLLKIKITPIKMENISSTQLNFIDKTVVISEELTHQPVYHILKEQDFDLVIASKEQTETMGVNFIQIDDYKLVNVKSNLNGKLRMIGYDVIELEMKELVKGNCGIRGLVLPFY
jgi:N-dimethylarginine dimethylaminohydrolase